MGQLLIIVNLFEMAVEPRLWKANFIMYIPPEYRARLDRVHAEEPNGGAVAKKYEVGYGHHSVARGSMSDTTQAYCLSSRWSIATQDKICVIFIHT